MEKYLYRLDEIGKAILVGIYRYGKTKTFAEILSEGGFAFDNARQVEIAISLESLELINSVSYQLPLKISAELTSLGESVVRTMLKPKENKIRKIINETKRRLGNDLDFRLHPKP